MIRGIISNLRKRKGLLRIAENSAWLFSDRLIRAGVGVVVGAYVARYLGPNSFGVLNFVFAYLLLFTSLAAFGLDGVVVRDLVKEEQAVNEILGTAFALKFCLAVIALILGNSLVHLVSFDYHGLWLLVAVASTAMLVGVLDVVDFRFQSQLNGKAIVTARTSAFIFASVVKVLLVVVGAPLVFFAASPALEAVLAAALLLYLYWSRERENLRWSFNRERATQLLRTAFPIACSAIFVVAIMQIDKLILGSIKGGGAVGIYSAAALLSSALYMVPLVVGASVAPALVRLHEAGSPEYQSKMQDVFSILSLAAISLGTATVLLADSLIGWIFGAAYAAAAPVLVVHVWTGIFIAHVSIRSRVLLIEGKTGLVAWFSALTLLSNVILNIVWIKQYGALGAAYASLVSWGLCTLLFPCFTERARGFLSMFLISLVPAAWLRALRG
jgi:PST family polysaccharide transporter